MPASSPATSSSASCPLAPLRVLSINHRTHGIDRLATLAATPAAAADIQASMTNHRIESVLLTTCNRVELYWRSSDPRDDVVAAGSLAAAVGARAEDLTGPTAVLAGAAAAHHLFRVCAGLESMVVGEAEVLGQARLALDSSRAARRFMTGVFRAAIRSGRAARAETAIGQGAASVASTGIHWLATRVPLANRRVLIVGAGDTARKVARHLQAIGTGSLVIANRTVARAADLARAVGAEAVGLDTLQHEIMRADAIVSAVNVSGWLITHDHLRPRYEAGRPLFVVDLSMPPSVEPVAPGAVDRIDLGVLAQVVEATRAQRSAEAPRVEVIIARELAWLRRWAAREALRPAAVLRTEAPASQAAPAAS